MSETSAAKLIANPTGISEDTTSEDIESTLEDDEDQEVEATEEESTEDEETTEEQEDTELPDEVKDILSKNRKELRTVKADLKAAQKRVSELEAGNGEASEEGNKFKKLFVNTAAKSALAEAGLATGTDRMLKLLDLSSVEVDEDGSISGLSDQIADLKEDFPDLFAVKPTKKIRSDAGGRREAPSVPKTSAQKLLEGL